ncbi:methyltransferase [Pseudonocardia sp. CNS-139]|nr:methyltransferase [Pseudonocardia sp. CNS-139]
MSGSRRAGRRAWTAALDGVATTTLWTLRNRAEFALGPDPLIQDPWAVHAYRTVRYDYTVFGRKPSQSHPLRALAVDRELRGYLRERPDATVVALGEGLQTTFWRLGLPVRRWVSVDLPAVVALREQLYPAEDAIVPVAGSALDRSWMDEVHDPGDGVFVTAEGLFMYLDRQDVLGLVADCARRFPGGRLLFDSIPHWFSRRTLAGMRLSESYTAPPMPTAFTVRENAAVFGALPGVAAVRDVALPLGRGPWGSALLHRLSDLPPLRDVRPSLTLLDFAG